MVSGAKEYLPSPIPNGEGKVTQELLRAVVTPFFVAGQDQFTVGDLIFRTAVKVESGDQFIPVVNPDVSSQDKILCLVRQRQFLTEGFGRGPEHSVSESRSAFVPDPCSVRSPMRGTLKHAFQVGAFYRTAIKVIDPGNGAHRLCLSRPDRRV